jgi:transcriptional regulator with PAS, ATPase and Fis domain
MGAQPSDREIQAIFARLGFVTCSPNVTSVLPRAYKASLVSDITILLEGETGTGKQVLAQAIHQLDKKRNSFSFVTVHCSTISETLAESELFGHQRGAFSGAVGERKGLFQSAQRGTIFLDDINDLPLHLQPKLLDVIQRGTVRPVGADREVRLDVRIVAACNQPLEPMVRQGRFRSDLFHRLNVVKLTLPPLRDRSHDLLSLILAFAQRHNALYQPIEQVEPQLAELLATKSFLGNVRELENAVQRMLFLKTAGKSLGLEDWITQSEPEECGKDPDLISDAAGAVWKAISHGLPFPQALQQIERSVLELALKVQGCTRRQLAKQLRTSERALYYKMRAYRIKNPAA